MVVDEVQGGRHKVTLTRSHYLPLSYSPRLNQPGHTRSLACLLLLVLACFMCTQNVSYYGHKRSLGLATIHQQLKSNQISPRRIPQAGEVNTKTSSQPSGSRLSSSPGWEINNRPTGDSSTSNPSVNSQIPKTMMMGDHIYCHIPARFDASFLFSCCHHHVDFDYTAGYCPH